MSFWDRILLVLTILILAAVGALLVSSGLNLIPTVRESGIIAAFRLWCSLAAMACSALLILLNVILTRHVFMEYWLTAAAGFVMGLIYLA